MDNTEICALDSRDQLASREQLTVKAHSRNNESENTAAHSSPTVWVTVMKHSSQLPNIKAQK